MRRPVSIHVLPYRLPCKNNASYEFVYKIALEMGNVVHIERPLQVT